MRAALEEEIEATSAPAAESTEGEKLDAEMAAEPVSVVVVVSFVVVVVM